MDKIFKFDKTTGTLKGYVGYIWNGLRNNDPKFDKYRDLVIPAEIDGVKVKEIGLFAFMSNELTSVTIPEGVTKIGLKAFQNNQLTSINIPNSVTEIGVDAFGYNKLTSLVIPESVKCIEFWAFADNELTSVKFPGSLEEIGDEAFVNNQLTSVNIPENVITIGDEAFDNDVEINRTQKPAKPKLKVNGEIKKVDKQASVKGQR